MLKRTLLIMLISLLALSTSGCFLTKIVTVPMRVTGAVISVVPVVGNTADSAIDSVADGIDEIPI